MKKKLLVLAFLSIAVSKNITAQSTSKLSVTACDGGILAGYADNGAFLNFTGPGIKWTKKPFSVLVGVLPTLKFKEDKSTVKNAFVTPTLGAGITVFYKHLAIQVPFFYSAKTATKNGKWLPGIGIGYKF